MSVIIKRRAGASALAAALLAALLVPLAGTAPAAAATTTAAVAPPTTVSADALPTVQVNGVVWSQVVVGNRVYATGSFTSARPAGAAAGTSETPRSNILAYDITTGELITSWAPSLNGQGLVVEASPDGEQIYVGGSFTSVSGTARSYLAALDATTGALVTGFNPRVNSRVRTLEAVGSTVYAGGAFNAVAGTPRARLAAVDAATGALLAWNPSADNEPYAMVAVPALNELVVGGRFATLNGEQNRGMGALDLTTGATLPWAADARIANYGNDSAIYSLSTDGTRVFGTAYDYFGPSPFESAFAADPAGGAIVWVNGCKGDTYSAVPMGGVLYTAGHAHDCAMQGGHPQTQPWTFQRAQAFDASGGTTNSSGSFGGSPAASILGWNPTLAAGTFTGQSQAAWTVAANDGYVVYGGEFPRVNGTAQQGLVRFALRSAAPNQQGPQGYPELTPTLLGTAPGTVRAGFTAAWDRDDTTLTYELVRGTGSAAVVVDTTTAASSWWSRPTLGLRDTTAPGGSTQTYRIRVTDPSGNAVPGATATTTVPAGSGAPTAYTTAVTADAPTHFWRLGDASTTTAYDSAGASDLRLGAGAVRGTTGALPEADTATTLPGTATVPATTTTLLTAPSTFSLEAWVNTTSRTGGKIIGFGSSATAGSSSFDRMIYLGNDGRVNVGVSDGRVKAITSPTAVNDGTWHHLVATVGSEGTTLYIDGVAVATDRTMKAVVSYRGYWRVGGDNLSGWTNRPTSPALNGSLDEVAVYPGALTREAVARHWVAAGGTAPDLAPTAEFTATATDLTVDVDSSDSRDADDPVVSSAWTFGDGATATGATASHTYAAAGTYTVELTVTDDEGERATTTQEVRVTAPNAAPVALADVRATDLVVTVDGAGSTDADGTVASWAWDFGDGATATGVTASHTYAAAGAQRVTLTVTDDRGATATSTQDVTVTAPVVVPPVTEPPVVVPPVTDPPVVVPPTSTALAADTFTRTATGGLGQAETGGAWTLTNGGAASQAVDGAAGVLTIPRAGATVGAALAGVSSSATDLSFAVSADKAATGGGTYVYATVRRTDGGDYRARVRQLADGRTVLALVRVVGGTETLLGGEAVVPGASTAPGSVLRLRVQATGTGTTDLRARAWADGTAEPTTWLRESTDTTAALQVAGSIAVSGYLSGSATGAPLALRLDDVAATRL